MSLIKRITTKIKKIYEVIVTDDDLGKFDKESKISFLKFLDIITNISIAFFTIFGIVSLYFFVTRAIL